MNEHTINTLDEIHYFVNDWGYSAHKLTKIVFGLNNKPLNVAAALEQRAALYNKVAAQIREQYTVIQREKRKGKR